MDYETYVKATLECNFFGYKSELDKEEGKE